MILRKLISPCLHYCEQGIFSGEKFNAPRLIMMMGEEGVEPSFRSLGEIPGNFTLVPLQAGLAKFPAEATQLASALAAHDFESCASRTHFVRYFDAAGRS